MSGENDFISFTENFKEEEEALSSDGIRTWASLKNLNDEALLLLVKSSRATKANLQRLRGIARLLCELNISHAEAALLMHSGIASIKALSSLTPQQLVQKTGRFERQLKTGRRPLVDLVKARLLIKMAIEHQLP